MNKPSAGSMSAVVPTCPQLSPTGQDRTGEERRGEVAHLPPSQQRNVSRTAPEDAGVREAGWIVYADELAFIEEEARVLNRRLDHLHERHRQIRESMGEAA